MEDTKEINKFLTEAMGECWHDVHEDGDYIHCLNCGKDKPYCNNKQFFTWEGFGKLWEWSIKQEWWETFQDMVIGDTEVYTDGDITKRINEEYINPEEFARSVFLYLKTEPPKEGE